MKKARYHPESNYFAIQNSNCDIFRYQVDERKPITRLQYPEIVDISLGTFCTGGCPYCYASANSKGLLYKNILDKVGNWLNDMSHNQRPFQIAIGGGGEPTFHPDLPELLKLIRSFGVIPSYTTAGIHMTDELLEATKEYCGGVAVTRHAGIPKWQDAVKTFLKNEIRTNIHHIVGKGENGISIAKYLRAEFPGVDKIVLLPFVPMGYGKSYTEVDEEELAAGLVLSTRPGYAIGAMYQVYMDKWPCLFARHSTFNEEDFSGYLELSDPPVMFKSSFNREKR